MRLIGTATLLVSLFALARALDPLHAGLTATYFPDDRWTSTPVRTLVDDRPSTARLIGAWRGEPPSTFSTTWRGSIIALTGGTYTFATRSDDGSWVYVDDKLVVANGGRHEARTAQGTITLDRGVHAIFIQYFQDGGALEFELLWGRDGAALTPVPSWALATPSPDFRRFLVSVVVRRALVAFAWFWLAAVVASSAWTAWRQARRVRWTADDALIAVGCLVLVAVLPHEVEGDGRARFLALAQAIEWHEIPATAYSLIGPLLSSPLYLVGRVALTPEWWCARFNAAVFIGGLVMSACLLRERVSGRAIRTFLLVMIAASLFPYHLEGYYAEAFTAVLVAVGLLAVDAGRAGAGWTAAAIGAANTPAAIVGLGAASVVKTWESRRLRHVVPVVAAAGLVLLESWIRRGSPFLTGYEGNHGDRTLLTYSGQPGFSYPLIFGILSILLSFGKGLVFYAPGLLLPLRKPPAFYKLWLAFLAGLIVIYAKWWAWFGGLFWGPRFFVFASFPASLAIAIWIDRAPELRPTRLAALLGVLTLAAWVAIDGVAFGYSGLGACRDANAEWLCLYVPEFSALWRPFVEWTRPSLGQAAVAAYFAVVYVWLAAPIASRLASAIGRSAPALTRAFTTGESWRF